MGQGEKPRCHSHPLRAQEDIITSDSMLFTHDSSKIVEPSMIVIDLEEMERNMLKEGAEIKLKISGGMENIQVRATSHTPGHSTNLPVESFICTCIAACRLAAMGFYFMFYFICSCIYYF